MLKGKKNEESKQVYKDTRFHDSFSECTNELISIHRAAFELEIDLKFRSKENSIIAMDHTQQLAFEKTLQLLQQEPSHSGDQNGEHRHLNFIVAVDYTQQLAFEEEPQSLCQETSHSCNEGGEH